MITVVVPAWDVDDVLPECLQSVQGQDLVPSILVVDNASGSPIQVPPGVAVLRLPKRVSVGAARNAGLAAVDTEYVLFLDADDLLLPGVLRRLHRRLEERPEVVGTCGGILAWDPTSGERAAARWPFRWAIRLHRHKRLFAVVNCVRDVFPTVGPVMMTTSAAKASGGFGDASWAEDWALGASLCFCGSVDMFSEPCELYRIDANRRTLSDIKADGGWPAARAGRALVRHRLRVSPVVPRWLRVLSWLLVPFHLFYSAQDLIVARQRLS